MSTDDWQSYKNVCCIGVEFINPQTLNIKWIIIQRNWAQNEADFVQIILIVKDILKYFSQLL